MVPGRRNCWVTAASLSMRSWMSWRGCWVPGDRVGSSAAAPRPLASSGPDRVASCTLSPGFMLWCLLEVMPNDLQLWKLLKGCEVESGLGHEAAEQARLVLHPPEPGLDERGQLADVLLDQVGQR